MLRRRLSRHGQTAQLTAQFGALSRSLKTRIPPADAPDRLILNHAHLGGTQIPIARDEPSSLPSRGFLLWRFSDAGHPCARHVRQRPASENLHTSRHRGCRHLDVVGTPLRRDCQDFCVRRFPSCAHEAFFEHDGELRLRLGPGRRKLVQ